LFPLIFILSSFISGATQKLQRKPVNMRRTRYLLAFATVGDTGYNRVRTLLPEDVDLHTVSHEVSEEPMHFQADLSKEDFYQEHAGEFDVVIVDICALHFVIGATDRSVYELLTMLVRRDGSLFVSPHFQPKCMGSKFEEIDGRYGLIPFMSSDSHYAEHHNNCRHPTAHIYRTDFICAPPMLAVRKEWAWMDTLDAFLGDEDEEGEYVPPTRFPPRAHDAPEEFLQEWNIRREEYDPTDEETIRYWAQWSFNRETPALVGEDLQNQAMINLQRFFSGHFDLVHRNFGNYFGIEDEEFFECVGKL